ncbi:MAG: type II toxin-antitoxin system RelE/ParE family toxin [Chloroflexota bacterium]|nr:type II toxin-antitoxin system RelE/ParE family toxin [Chloroflexota bacterium]
MAQSAEIILSPEALDHISAFKARQRRIILDEIETQLSHEPTFVTQQRKPMRPNPLASWELRIGQFRVYYQVEQDQADQAIVYIIAVGIKIRDRITIGGKEVTL